LILVEDHVIHVFIGERAQEDLFLLILDNVPGILGDQCLVSQVFGRYPDVVDDERFFLFEGFLDHDGIQALELLDATVVVEFVELVDTFGDDYPDHE